MRHIKTVAERSVASVRNISLLLRPLHAGTISDWWRLWSGRRGKSRAAARLRSDVESDEVPSDLGEEYKICIYRLVQEALNNVARHSRAHHAWVSVRRDPGKIAVSIRDDGRGFDPDRAKGLGLLGMEERVRRLRGGISRRIAAWEGRHFDG